VKSMAIAWFPNGTKSFPSSVHVSVLVRVLQVFGLVTIFAENYLTFHDSSFIARG
jgi:hypothetical protein